MNLYAKKRGAELIIWKKDGQLIKGELIAVKENSLLILDAEGKDVNIEIHEITLIGFKRKLRMLKGFVQGTLICAGYLIIDQNFISSGNRNNISFRNLIWDAAVFGGSTGALVAVLTRGSPRTIKTLHMEGMADSEIQKTLDILRKKARIRNNK